MKVNEPDQDFATQPNVRNSTKTYIFAGLPFRLAQVASYRGYIHDRRRFATNVIGFVCRETSVTRSGVFAHVDHMDQLSPNAKPKVQLINSNPRMTQSQTTQNQHVTQHQVLWVYKWPQTQFIMTTPPQTAHFQHITMQQPRQVNNCQITRNALLFCVK